MDHERGTREQAPLCRLCGRPVAVNRTHYGTFEKMHWLCFHLSFEHDGDADEPCQDPSCSWWHIRVYRQRLERLGCDPEEVLGEAVDGRCGL